MIPSMQITFRNIPESAAVTGLIRAEAAKLERFFERIVRLRVLVEMPHRHHQRGAPCRVRIEIDVPGKELVINSNPTKHATLTRTEASRVHKSDELDVAHKDAALAVQDAFRKAVRRMQDYARREDGSVKTHATKPSGEVSLLRGNYGFIRTPDGRDVYFHRNSCLNNTFARLQVGSPVRFAEEDGENGAQASTVALVQRISRSASGSAARRS